MADYAKMYKGLFRAVTESIEILQKAQQEAEEIFISADEPIIALIRPESVEENKDDDQS